MRTRSARLAAGEELAAQRLACRVLIEGCECALGGVRLGRAVAAGGEELRTALRAREILEEILQSWRETAEVLEGPATGGAGRKSSGFTAP